MKRSASYYFWSVIALGGIFLAVFLIVLWNAMPFAAIGWRALLGHISDFCERLNKANKLVLYGITFGFFISAFTIIYSSAKIFFSAAKTAAISRKTRTGSVISKKIARAARRAGLKISDIEIISGEFSPFCAGLLRPKILLANSFAEKLNIGELTAVLLHEKKHLKSSDVLKTLAIRFFCHLFFFVPVLKILAQKYYLASELEADAKASAGFRFRGPLLGAMNKIYESRYQSLPVPGIATTIDMRMGFLLSLENWPKISVTGKQMMFSLILAIAFVAVFLISFHFNHALSVEVVKYNEGQMTPVSWNKVSFFNSSNLYLTPINQTKNITQCAGQAVNFSHL